MTEVHSLSRLAFTSTCRTGPTERTGSLNGWQDAFEKPGGPTADVGADVLRILFSNAVVEESDEEKPGLILDFDKIGNSVGMEILYKSKRIEDPRAVEYAVIG